MSTILVVDDNATNRKLLATLLRYEGHEIVEAVDGADGLTCARQHRPQLVISDILMPSMDGYEFVRRLRADADLAQTAVIFYTANYHQREAHSLAKQCQVNRVMVKPCAPADLLRAVESALTAGEPPPAKFADPGFDADHLRLLTNKLARTADELQAANDRLAALVELNTQLASEREPQTLLNKVCSGARSLIAARFGVLAVTDRLSSARVLTAASGLEVPVESPPLRVDTGALGSLVRESRAIRVTNRDAASFDIGLPATYPTARSFVAAPITSPTRAYGWICLADKLGGTEFDAEDERLLTILGAQVGRIYENGSLYTEAQNYAAELLVEMGERERAVKELLASEERFRQLAETIQDVFFIAEPDLSRVIYVSPAYERVWGCPCQQLLDDPRSVAVYVHPDDRQRALAQQQRIANELPTPGHLEFRIVRPDGLTRWIQIRVFAICNAGGAVTRAVGVASDVTERNLAEAKVKHLNRVHSMLSGINSLIVRADNRDTLLNDACRLAINPGMFGAVWCGLLDSAGQLRTAAAAGDFAELPQAHADANGAAVSGNLISEAINSKQAVICNDLRDIRASDTFHEALLANGYRAEVALPLIIAGSAVGCLTLATRESGLFDADEMRLLTELAGDIAFALDHIGKAEQLSYLAYYDILTGLPNRALFEDRLTQLVNAAKESSGQLAVIIADPERFAVFNDTIGRATADQLLREVALRFAHSVGTTDRVGRIGSDHFAAVVTGLRSPTDVPRIMEELWRDWLRTPFNMQEQQIQVTARAGVAIFPVDGADAEALLRNAETALKTAKTSGRLFAAYTAGLSEEFAERVTVERNLRRALEREEFVLHYQPKVDLQTRRLQGLEALIRWNSPELGLVPPAKFISVIEENGLIVEVGTWALRQASLDSARWRERHLKAPRVAVNVSTVQLRRDDFVRTLSNIVRIAGSDSGLDIEVTESLLMADVADNLAKLAAIRDLGVKIFLDDFGTGYSSLSYVARLPVHALKIDRSFVSTMLDDPSAMTLVSTIISLARALKLETVAEGVESEEQAKILRLLQCDEMQGFLISKPLPFDEMTGYLSRSKSF